MSMAAQLGKIASFKSGLRKMAVGVRLESHGGAGNPPPRYYRPKVEEGYPAHMDKIPQGFQQPFAVRHTAQVDKPVPIGGTVLPKGRSLQNVRVDGADLTGGPGSLPMRGVQGGDPRSRVSRAYATHQAPGGRTVVKGHVPNLRRESGGGGGPMTTPYMPTVSGVDPGGQTRAFPFSIAPGQSSSSPRVAAAIQSQAPADEIRDLYEPDPKDRRSRPAYMVAREFGQPAAADPQSQFESALTSGAPPATVDPQAQFEAALSQNRGPIDPQAQFEAALASPGPSDPRELYEQLASRGSYAPPPARAGAPDSMLARNVMSQPGSPAPSWQGAQPSSWRQAVEDPRAFLGRAFSSWGR